MRLKGRGRGREGGRGGSREQGERRIFFSSVRLSEAREHGFILERGVTAPTKGTVSAGLCMCVPTGQSSSTGGAPEERTTRRNDGSLGSHRRMNRSPLAQGLKGCKSEGPKLHPGPPLGTGFEPVLLGWRKWRQRQLGADNAANPTRRSSARAKAHSIARPIVKAWRGGSTEGSAPRTTRACCWPGKGGVM